MNRIIVGWLCSVQNLHQRRHGLIHRIAGETMHVDARAVIEQATKRYFFRRRELVFRNLPRAKFKVDIVVQRELAFVDVMQRDHRGDGFANRSRLKQRVRRDRRPLLNCRRAETAGPFELVVGDDRRESQFVAFTVQPVRAFYVAVS
jgi:hypothetical protein